jgi:hypothetical protein
VSSEFIETLGYDNVSTGYKNQKDFESTWCSANWIVDIRKELESILQKERKTLSLGSGRCEHEIPFIKKRYDITCSDIVMQPMKKTKQLYKDLQYRFFDILEPSFDIIYDDILITGLFYAFDDRRLIQASTNIYKLLKSHNSRFILIHRAKDSLFTRFIDNIVLPTESHIFAFVRNLIKHLLKKKDIITDVSVVKRHHGYRRSEREIIELVTSCGFSLSQVIHTAHENEIERSKILRTRQIQKFLAFLSRTLFSFANYVTIFEFYIVQNVEKVS